jgi:hypothetical protein
MVEGAREGWKQEAIRYYTYILAPVEMVEGPVRDPAKMQALGGGEKKAHQSSSVAVR